MELDLKQVIREPKNILIVPAINSDFDLISASVALAFYLKNSGKKVTVSSQFLYGTPYFSKKLKKEGINIASSNLYKNYEIRISPKIQVHYIEHTSSENETVLDLFTESQTDLKQENLIVNEKKPSFDLTVIIGANNPENLGFFFDQNRHLFVQSKYIMIAEDVLQDKRTNLVLIKKGKYSSSMFSILKTLKPSPDYDILTWILAGIVWRTDNYQTNIYQDMFQETSELIQMGADYKIAQDYNLKIVKSNITQVQKIIWQNFNSNDQGLFWSQIPKTIEVDEMIITNFLFSFSENPKCKVALLIIEKENYKQVFIKTNTSDIKLKNLVLSLGGKGTNKQGVFTTIMSDTEIITTIRTSLFGEISDDKSSDMSSDMPADFSKEKAADKPETKQTEQSSKPVPKSTPKPAETPAAAENYDPLAPAKTPLKPINLDNF
jgi:nanoRNase/pAp phosphatase (c-di-AMP/oligoRNAs hydrolase)